MRIGPLKLESNLFLSPLAGYTNLPFRLVVREIGGVGLCTTDLVNARSLLERRERAFKLIETRPADSPLARSEEHTSELQSRLHLVCRLLLEKKKQHDTTLNSSTRG